MNSITPELAEILGLLCAEGSHIVSYTNYFEMNRGTLRFRKNKKSERIEFYNKDKKLLWHYNQLLNQEFDYYPKVTKWGKVNICKKVIIAKIISYTHLGHLSWRVPEVVFDSSDEVKLLFIRGYFDGDGTSSGSSVRMFSVNQEGINQVSRLLNSLEFEHTIQGPILKMNRKPGFILQISAKEKERFLKAVNPISKRSGMRGL
ncbi:MAG TPA: LAGLIDADG family homing endonuclease [Candidatus Nanoarchaeia archaeon]|nr:LAGLIDADG family homing endonuclease [Candidatus Nanoarchaeia archaeon]